MHAKTCTLLHTVPYHHDAMLPFVIAPNPHTHTHTHTHGHRQDAKLCIITGPVEFAIQPCGDESVSEVLYQKRCFRYPYFT